MSHNPSSSIAAGTNLDKFFEDVEAIKDELKEVEHIHHHLHESNEASKTLHATSAIRNLRAHMDDDIATTLKRAKLIKLHLKSLDCSNTTNHSLPRCSPVTSTNRTRTSIVAGLFKKLKDSMEGFGKLRKRVSIDYWEAIEWRYYTVIGEKPDEETVEALVVMGEGERFLQRAIKEQGRGRVLDMIAKIQERHGATAELERSLLEL